MSTQKLVLLIAVAALAIAVFAGGVYLAYNARVDNGWIVDECGEAKWTRGDLPVEIFVERGDEELIPAVELAFATWPVLAKYTRLGGITDPHKLNPPTLANVLRLDRDTHPDDEQRVHGRTRFVWSANDRCRLVRAESAIPAEVPAHMERLRALIVAHEILHGLRLADDNLDTSIMHIRASLTIERSVTAGDEARLESAYGLELHDAGAER